MPTVVRLEENYRSTPQILELANTVISANTERMGKTLRATHGAGRARHRRSLARRARRSRLRRRRDDGAAIGVVDIAARTTSRCSIERTRRAARSKKRCASTPCRTGSSAPCASTIVARFATSCRISSSSPIRPTTRRSAARWAFRNAGSAKRRSNKLGEASRARGLPMFEGAQLADVVATLRPAARIALAEFVRLILSLRERAAEAAVDELLQRARGRDSIRRLSARRRTGVRRAPRQRA